MKIKYLKATIFFFAALFAFNSCDMSSETNYSPLLSFYRQVKLNSDSTLLLSYTDEGNLKLDSIHLNDTILIAVVGNGYVNNLTDFNFEIKEPSHINVIIPDSIKAFFSDKSEFEKGNYLFKEKITGISFPFQFVAKEVSTKTTISFQLSSDARKVSNVSLLKLEFPIKP